MAGGDPAPLGRATRVAAGIAAVGLARSARVTAWSARDAAAQASPPVRGPGRIMALLRFLAALEARGGSGLLAAADRVARSGRAHGAVAIVTDLLGRDAAKAALRLVRAGFDAAVVLVSPRDEIEPGVAERAVEAGAAVLVDSETGEERLFPIAAPSLPLARAARDERARGDAVAIAERALPLEPLAWDRPFEDAALALLGTTASRPRERLRGPS
jgi:hypothetical protein